MKSVQVLQECLTALFMMVTGTDANGVQIGEFGSSEGYLDEKHYVGDVRGAPEKR